MTLTPFQRPLGRTGLMVSPIGLGTVKLGRNQRLKHPQPFELPSRKEAEYLLDCAHDLGINFIDTAAAYGSSEARLGELLRSEERRVGKEGRRRRETERGTKEKDMSRAGQRGA